LHVLSVGAWHDLIPYPNQAVTNRTATAAMMKDINHPAQGATYSIALASSTMATIIIRMRKIEPIIFVSPVVKID
jgi:hypothetical protein